MTSLSCYYLHVPHIVPAGPWNSWAFDSMHKPTGLPAQISVGVLVMVQVPTQRGCDRNPLAGQIISKSFSFSPELSLHP